MHVLHTCALKAQWFSGRYDTAQVCYDAGGRFDPSDLFLMPLTVFLSPERAHAAYASMALLVLFGGLWTFAASFTIRIPLALAWCAPMAWSYVLVLGFIPFLFAAGWALAVAGWWNRTVHVRGRDAGALVLGLAIAQGLHRGGGVMVLLLLGTMEHMRWRHDPSAARARFATLHGWWRWAAAALLLGSGIVVVRLLARTPLVELPAPRSTLHELLTLRPFLLMHAGEEGPYLIALGALSATGLVIATLRRIQGRLSGGATDGLWAAALLLFALSVFVDTPYARLLFLPARAAWLGSLLLGTWVALALPRSWWTHALVGAMVLVHAFRLAQIEARMAGSLAAHEDLLAAVEHIRPHGVVLPFNRDDNWLHDHLGAYLAARYEGVCFSPHDHLRFTYAGPVADTVRIFGTGPQHGLRWLSAHVERGDMPALDHVLLIGHGDRKDERARNVERTLARHFRLTWQNPYVEVWTHVRWMPTDSIGAGLNLAPQPTRSE
jgi:hypothetical protein